MHTFIVNNAVARVLHITTKQSINTQKSPFAVGDGLAPPEKTKDKINLSINTQNTPLFTVGEGSPLPKIKNNQHTNKQKNKSPCFKVFEG